MADDTPSAGPGFVPVSDLLVAASRQAVYESAGECSRADGKRGMVYLSVQLCLGDGGEPLWLTSSVHFEPKRHYKDARGSLIG